MCLLLLDKGSIARLNPFLTSECINEIHRVVRLYLELEVLREKLARLLQTHCGCGQPGEAIDSDDVLANVRKNEGLIVQEIRCTRKWPTAEHPEWLVFEVENRLQIRPQQYDVAARCIKNPGAILQLNMGEGKTRVIVPMLVLHWTSARARRAAKENANKTNSRPPIVRITVLRPLLSEFYEYLTQKMQHSVFQKRVYLAPFNRDVDVRCPKNAKRLRDTLVECACSGGVLLETPESSLSKLLKYYELAIELDSRNQRLQFSGEEDPGIHDLQESVKLLEEIVHFPAFDVLDEADEELKHKYQLIYAHKGASRSTMALPDGEIRWHSLQAIFRVLNDSEANEVGSFLDRYGEVCCRGAACFRGTFRPVRFIAGQSDWARAEVRRELAEVVLDELVGSPPFELKSLESLREGQLPYVRRFVLDPGDSHAQDAEFTSIENPQVRTILLCLRGYLSCGIAFSCLEKRHRVQYGLYLKPGGKQLAIPYRASDSPAERAEFGHPDMALGLTHLSYYYDGLTDSQLYHCFKQLQRQGPAAQAKLYSKWFRLMCDDPDATDTDTEDRRTIDTAEKLDLDNEAQFHLLCRSYRTNFEVINFFLNVCVLPVETRQYPHKIVANAYNLAESFGHKVGFSGTKDNLLPPEVQQHTLEHLQGTDGKMMACVMRNPTYHCAAVGRREVGEKGPCSGWKSIVDNALSRGRYDVLLDAGGLLAGSSNRDVATYILERYVQQKDCAHSGVLYFEPGNQPGGGRQSGGAASNQHGEWMVVDLKGVHEARAKSPLVDAACFAFYDQSRTRGSDLKLRHDAKGLVTVGPGMCKDQIMQAIGRLRGIHFAQAIEFFGPEEVTKSIMQACEAFSGVSGKRSVKPTSGDLLFWVTLNTIREVESALMPWAAQGATYCAVAGDPSLALQDEKCDLISFYGPSTKKQALSEVGKNQFQCQLQLAQKRSGGGVDGATIGTTATSTRSTFMAREGCRYQRTEQAVFEQLGMYGRDLKVVASMLDDEYERELEKEEEEEQERELPNPEKPAASSTWNYRALVERCVIPKMAAPESQLRRTSAIPADCPEEVEHILDSMQLCLSGKVRVSCDFCRTVACPERYSPCNGLDLYLRAVNSYMLLFTASGELNQCVLVTDKESGIILNTIYDHGRSLHARASSAEKNRLIVVTHIPNGRAGSSRQSSGSCCMGVNRAGEPVDVSSLMSDSKVLTCLQLYNGESAFPTEERKHVVRWLLGLESTEFVFGVASYPGGASKGREVMAGIIKAIREMRGRSIEFDRSDLDAILKGSGVSSVLAPS
jgi:hypothetical protein